MNGKAGRPTKPRPARAELQRLYIAEGLALRDVAAALGVSKDLIARALAEYGIRRRTGAKRSRLRKADHARLFADLAELGPSRTARKWGIPRRTFNDYMAHLRPKKA